MFKRLFVWALRGVIVQIVAEIPKPKTMGNNMRKKVIKDGIDRTTDYWKNRVFTSN